MQIKDGLDQLLQKPAKLLLIEWGIKHRKQRRFGAQLIFEIYVGGYLKKETEINLK